MAGEGTGAHARALSAVDTPNLVQRAMDRPDFSMDLLAVGEGEGGPSSTSGAHARALSALDTPDIVQRTVDRPDFHGYGGSSRTRGFYHWGTRWRTVHSHYTSCSASEATGHLCVRKHTQESSTASVVCKRQGQGKMYYLWGTRWRTARTQYTCWGPVDNTQTRFQHRFVVVGGLPVDNTQTRLQHGFVGVGEG
jgi:hypothetical protein